MEVKLGDYVMTTEGSYFIGRVKALHIFFSESGENMSWFNEQKAKWSKETLSKPWVSILVNGGGCVLFPISAVKKTLPFDFENTWSDFYFGGNK